MTEMTLKVTEDSIELEDGTPMNYGAFFDKFPAGSILTVTATGAEDVKEETEVESPESDSEGSADTQVQNEGAYGTQEAAVEEDVPPAAAVEEDVPPAAA